MESMGHIGVTEGQPGRTRLALTREDKEGRDLFVSLLEEEDLHVHIDAIGNIWGIRPGYIEAAPVMMGSHLDTVAHAGMFDGALGVLAGLEVIRTLNERNIRTRKPLAVASFTNEEGARFQPDMMGSLVASGNCALEEALAAVDDNGIRVKDALEEIGYAGKDRLRASSYLELHVEQGPVLERENVEIGVVKGIQGIAWWHGTFRGEANHAGTTPLEYRKDSLLAVSELCCEMRGLAEKIGEGALTTVGRVHPYPDIINVIPAETWFSLDFRHSNRVLFEEGKKSVEDLVRHMADKHGVALEFDQVANAMPVSFPLSMIQMVQRYAHKSGYSWMPIVSGAGHDAQFMHRMCPSAMIFVPSAGGRSHCPEEHTSWEDIKKGADILLLCALEMAGRE